MNNPIQLPAVSRTDRNLIGQWLSRGGLFLVVVIACITFSPQAPAACQQGCNLGASNTYLGDNALVNNTTGQFDSAIGATALESNTTGLFNTATGFHALQANTIGAGNTAAGANTLRENSSGNQNTAVGDNALFSNTSGGNNTATGESALLANTTGGSNTATGMSALSSNTTGSSNLANGFQALLSNTTGNNNMATGARALRNNTTGNFNMANGGGALRHNTTGTYNSANGINALGNNTTGNFNIAFGLSAGTNLTTGNNNIDIGNPGVAVESSRIRIGTKRTHSNTYVAGISGVAVAGGVGVVVDSDGHLGTIVSSKRFKEEIKPIDKESEAILQLEPVSFRYKHELDPNDIPQFGLVAEEVEKVNPDLVARDDHGKAYTVRYEAVNAMLLNEFLKEHRTVQDLKTIVSKQETTIAQQQKEIETLAASFKAKALLIQKVSEQLGLSKPARRLAANELD
jgi:hypothetical protein